LVNHGVRIHMNLIVIIWWLIDMKLRPQIDIGLAEKNETQFHTKLAKGIRAKDADPPK